MLCNYIIGKGIDCPSLFHTAVDGATTPHTATSLDSILTKEFGKIVREEYKSLGIRLALGPMADTSTEPRWARVNGTFGDRSKIEFLRPKIT